VNAPTTLGLVGLNAQGSSSDSIYAEGAADGLLTLDALAALESLLSAQAFQFGSYTMVVEPMDRTLRALVEREHRRSVIALDQNVRLNMEPDLARWRNTLHWMLPRTHILKFSDEDLGLLYPGVEAANLAAAWLAAGVALVMVTRGGAGA